jgi:dienelactone hydrolase
VSRHPYEGVERRLLAAYADGDFADALATLDREGASHPNQWERTAYWRTCLLARLGRVDDAIDNLRQATEAGAWWSPRLLELENDLDPLWDHPGYRPLLEAMDRHRRTWDPPARGVLVGGRSEASPFLGLHGRNQIYEVDAAHLLALASGRWEIAIPESEQRIASDGPVWDDPDRCHHQVRSTAATLWGERPYGVVGFSQGGRRALQHALGDGETVPVALAIAPMLRRASELAEVIESLRAPPWPLVMIVTGERDPAAAGVDTLAAHLTDEGLEVRVHIEPGRGHEWIDPLPGWLESATQRLVDL